MIPAALRPGGLDSGNGAASASELFSYCRSCWHFCDRHILGHNYTLTLRLCAEEGTIRIGSDEKGWCERRFFSDSEAPSWKLVDMIGHRNVLGMTSSSHCLGINVGIGGVRRFVFTSVGAEDGAPEKRRTFDLWMYLWETGDEAARLRGLYELESGSI